MPYRNKTYVCFDADNNIHYYYLMLAWKQSDNTNFQFLRRSRFKSIATH